MGEKLGLKGLLEHVIPFRFLSRNLRALVMESAQRLEFEPLEWVFKKGEPSRDVYLLEEGQVERVLENTHQVRPENVIRSGHYFGEREPIFSRDRQVGVRALTTVVTWKIPEKSFLTLLKGSAVFAQALGTILRDKHGIFRAFGHFINEVKRAETRGYLPLASLIESYMDLEPALHPGASSKEVDFSALAYAVRRLPANVSRVFTWFLTDEMPAAYRAFQSSFHPVPSPGRRRDVWEMAPGKNMVLLRNGLSDLLDLVSCLCLFAVEAKKIRHKLQRPGVIEGILHYLKPQAQKEELPGFSLSLPFSDPEWEQIRRIWSQDTVARLREIALHHEDYTINLGKQWANYNSRRSEKWTIQISKGTREFLGLDPAEMDGSWKVHIISSNTHSVTNLLNPHLGSRAKEILNWGLKNQNETLEGGLEETRDGVYALLPGYLKDKENQGVSEELKNSPGIYRLRDTASTGIQVQIIHPHQIPSENLDPAVDTSRADEKTLIVNIDYAFGQQAQEILRHLILLFQGRIASINVLGKAGALQGKRGDILVPTAFMDQLEDAFHKVPDPDPVLLTSLSTMVSGRTIHAGPLLTVAGTLLQNHTLLKYYQNLWNCIGLEMEGSYYHGEIRRFQEQGLLNKDLPRRYFYYVSDLPLGHGPNLSEPMTPAEGIPPLYAISRQILLEILG